MKFKQYRQNANEMQREKDERIELREKLSSGSDSFFDFIEILHEQKSMHTLHKFFTVTETACRTAR